MDGRNEDEIVALVEIRRAWAPHLCGDQHLAVLVQHGIEQYRDGPFAFTSPAIVNTIYGRWWHPDDEKAGGGQVIAGPLPWTGDYEDGLGNLITMLAYANPADRKDETKRADGYGVARFRRADRKITFECWHRFADVRDGDKAQFPGWPVTIDQQQNDGRKIVGRLPEVRGKDGSKPVVQVIEQATGDILYTVRANSNSFRPPVYRPGKYTVRLGANRPNERVLTDLEPQ